MALRPKRGPFWQALPLMVLIVGLVATWFAYAPGLGGSLQFDDHHNLGGLATVSDRASAFGFIATGTAGPLGRPLALASFVPHAYAWPDGTAVLLRTNILIHLLNGVLLTWFLLLMGRAQRQTEHQAALISTGASAIWMLMPLLASSSLFIVQRMTTLSAMFVLIGAIAYMYARQTTDRSPILALCGMTIALGAGAALAALAKENGVLLFLYILAVEATLLDRPASISRRLWRSWFIAVLLCPLAVLLIFLASVIPYSENTVLFRNFTGYERLITQAGILWNYLYLAFLPNVGSLGPFHDDYPIQRTILSLLPLLSVGGWLAAIFAAFMLRRKLPLFTFAIAWYVLGHLLESTTVGLELYFEHRNYLPLIGPVYALVAGLVHIEQKWRRLAVIGTVAYGGVLGVILFSTASLWGSPVLAAEMWHIYKPNSLRAVQYLSGILESQGDPFAARRLLRRFSDANPEIHTVRLQELVITCRLERTDDHDEAIRSLEEKLSTSHFNHAGPIALEQLDFLVREGRCPSIDNQAVYRLGLSMLDNPRFNLPIVQHNIHVVMARIGIDQKDFSLAVTHMNKALQAYHNFDTLLLAVGILNSGGRLDISRDLLDDAKRRPAPRNPVRAHQWRNELERIDVALLAMERSR
jgi:protein O-mannosyl-transferase